MFSELQPSEAEKLQVASPTTPSWSQIARWLRQMDSLRVVVGGVAA